MRKRNKLLDKCIEMLNLKNDAALSRALEVSPPVISNIHSGKPLLGAAMIVRILRLTGMSIKEVDELLCGAKLENSTFDGVDIDAVHKKNLGE